MRTQRWMILTMVFGLLCGFVLSGCDVLEKAGDLLRITSSAEAQNSVDKRIETFVIEAGSFDLRTDALPTITVYDSATLYELVSNGEVRFTEPGGIARIELDLDNGDKVIERPASNHVTVVRDE